MNIGGPMALATLAAGLLLTAAGPATGQDIRDHGTTSRGRLGDRSVVHAAQALIARAGVDCEVTRARLRGRDATGAAQYEVTCRDGSGYFVIGPPVNEAHSCLALESPSGRSRAPTCRMPSNRNSLAQYRRFARAAGLDCRVDQGVMVGLSPRGGELYEIGCRGVGGAWIERSNGAWTAKDCLTVTAEGSTCRFTSLDETLATFRSWVLHTELATCDPRAVRAMGSSRDGVYYEVECAGGRPIVARFSASRSLVEVIACDQAGRIGGGCRLGR